MVEDVDPATPFLLPHPAWPTVYFSPRFLTNALRVMWCRLREKRALLLRLFDPMVVLMTKSSRVNAFLFLYMPLPTDWDFTDNSASCFIRVNSASVTSSEATPLVKDINNEGSGPERYISSI